MTTAVYNPYPDETRSFNAMPLDSPLQLLPYGLLTDMIVPLVAKKRIEYRQKIQREITAELGVKMMGHYLRELDYYDKDNKVINLRRIKWRLTNKKLLLDIVLKQDVHPFTFFNSNETMKADHLNSVSEITSATKLCIMDENEFKKES